MDPNKTQLLWTAPQPLLNDGQHLFPGIHALSAGVLSILSFIAPLTNVGDVTGLPQDTTKIDARNIPRTSLMSSKLMMTTMITYLLMQITTYPENADSSINQ